MRLTQHRYRYGLFGSRGMEGYSPMTATAEDHAAAVRAVNAVAKTALLAKRMARDGYGVDDLVVRLGLSREQAKRIVFGERKS